MSRVVHLDFGHIRRCPQLNHTPTEICVLTEVRFIEWQVKAIERLKRLVADEKVGSHEANPFETDIGNRTPIGIAQSIRADQAFEPDHRPVVEVWLRIEKPVFSRLAV